jgi:hypothetical protein
MLNKLIVMFGSLGMFSLVLAILCPMSSVQGQIQAQQSNITIVSPSNWNMLENLGNVSGNNIIADFYLTGIEGIRSYSENANVVILNQSEYLKNIMKKSLDTNFW